MKRFIFLFICILLIPSQDAFASQKVYTFDCETTAYKPTMLFEACGDGNSGWDKIKWTKWGTSGAEGMGERFWNDCDPYCAKGKFHSFRVKILLSKPMNLKGKIYLSKIKWAALSGEKVPSDKAKSGTWDLYEFYKMMKS